MCISFHLCETRQQVPQDTLQRSLCASVQSNTFIHQRHILLFFGAWQASDSSHDKKSSTQPWWVCPSFPLTASRLVLAPLQVHGCKVNVSHQRQRQRQRHRERERETGNGCLPLRQLLALHLTGKESLRTKVHFRSRLNGFQLNCRWKNHNGTQSAATLALRRTSSTGICGVAGSLLLCEMIPLTRIKQRRM